jgi:hypothetical protein
MAQLKNQTNTLLGGSRFSRLSGDCSGFLSRGFKQVPLEVVKGKVVYAHPDGYFVDGTGKRLKLQLLRRLDVETSHGGDYAKLSKSYGDLSCHKAMACAFDHVPDATEECDHINGDKTNFALSNIRVVKKEINARDGGFLRKLRNKGIDPTYYSAPFLLRYFDRMAEYKATHSKYRYARLSHDELLTMLVSPEFTVGDPNERME